MDITKIAYEKYKLDWMLSHGYTFADLMKELDIMQEESPDNTVSQLFDDWEYGFGFASEVWACYDEFIGHEFLDKAYMRKLLTKSEWNDYCKYIHREDCYA